MTATRENGRPQLYSSMLEWCSQAANSEPEPMVSRMAGVVEEERSARERLAALRELHVTRGVESTQSIGSLESCLESRRMQLASSSSAARLFSEATARCDLEKQLQEWRQESRAKKRQGNTGLLVPPCMSLEQQGRSAVGASLSAISMQDKAIGAATSSSAAQSTMFASTPGTSEHMVSSSSFSPPPSHVRPAEPQAVDSRREEGLSELGSAEFRLTPEALAAEAPSLASLRSTPLEKTRAMLENSGIHLAEDMGGLQSSVNAAEQLTEHLAAQNAADEAALRLQLVAVRTAADTREQELKDLQLPSDLAEWGVSEAYDPSEEEALLREAEEVRRLEEAIREADQCIEEYEGRLRIYDAAGSGDANGCSVDKSGWRGSEAPSLVSTSTAPTSAPTGPIMTDSNVWQDRAPALEREIRSESATALELQDRIHWLRGQIRRQPSDEDERIIAIRKMFEQIRDRLDFFAMQSTQAARQQLVY